MQRIANSSSPVQLWNAPPLKTSFYPPLLLSPSAIFNCFNSYKWNYCFCLTLVLLLLSQSNFFSFSSLSSFFSVRGRNYVPPICNSQLFVFLVVIFFAASPKRCSHLRGLMDKIRTTISCRLRFHGFYLLF